MSDLGPQQTGLLVAHYGNTLIVENQAGKLFRCSVRQTLDPVVTGDSVLWQTLDHNTGVVVDILPRKTLLTKLSRTGEKPLVANVDQLIIVIAIEPRPLLTTIDRYLILAHTFGITPLIVLNKVDLLIHQTQDITAITALLSLYTPLGYPIIRVSTKTGEGIDELNEFLENKNSLLAGQSGVGKSSLLNTLIPDASAQTKALSATQKQGRQTTTTTKLYHMKKGGHLVDSPGVHQFRLDHLSKDAILAGYLEFTPYLSKCQFRNCAHLNDPGCALMNALNEGKIARERFESYRALLESLT